jgi:hypothetical protein
MYYYYSTSRPTGPHQILSSQIWRGHDILGSGFGNVIAMATRFLRDQSSFPWYVAKENGSKWLSPMA